MQRTALRAAADAERYMAMAHVHAVHMRLVSCAEKMI